MTRFLFLLAFEVARAQVTVGTPEVLSEHRIARTLFEYEMRAKLTNPARAIDAVTVTSTSPNTTIVQGTLSFANVPALATADTLGTFTIRHDRTVPFDPSVLHWTFTYAPTKFTASPADGETEVSPARETILRFTRPLAADAVVNDTNLFAIANGERLPGTIRVATDRRTVSLFYQTPLPASTEVRVTLLADALRDDLARPVDADGDGQPGGAARITFRTLPLTRIPGTTVWGYVFDSYHKNPDGTDQPIVGATIRVDAFPAANAVTEATGRFELHDMPAPVFFVHIDGTTATNAPPGTMYPSVGKPFHSVPGQSTQLLMDRVPFHVYLPPDSHGRHPPALAHRRHHRRLRRGRQGRAGRHVSRHRPHRLGPRACYLSRRRGHRRRGQRGHAGCRLPVPPNRLPAPLSPNLTPRLVISVQALGATRFDVPAPVTFPNLDGLAPGEKELFLYFNHAVGKWEVIGTGTVSMDGQTITSDPGVGILAPGWHFRGDANEGEPCQRKDHLPTLSALV